MLHQTQGKPLAGVTLLLSFKNNYLSYDVTPVTLVTPHLKGIRPRPPLAMRSTSDETQQVPGPLRLFDTYGVGNPPDFVSGRMRSLVNW